MKRRDLEHIIRAAGAIAETRELVILGSQAILGMYPDAPEELLVSQEADTYPLDDPAKADLIDGTIGEPSPFHEQFGYYARGVSPEIALLPRDWRSRVVPVRSRNTQGVTGYCLHPSDLAVSKLLAGRSKDHHFVKTLLQHTLVSREEISERCRELPVDQADRVRNALDGLGS